MTPDTARQDPVDRAQRRKQATRNRLYVAAMELFPVQGYAETTMDDIAARADVARATAFNHFPGKHAIAFEWAARRRRRAAAAMAATGPGATTADRLRAYFHDLAEVNTGEFATTRQLVVAWVRGGGPVEDDPWLATALVECLRSGQQAGEIRASCDPFDAACLLRDAYFGVLFRWVRRNEDEAFELTPALDRTIDMVLEGIVGSGGRS